MNGWLLALLITAGILGILLLLRFGLRVEYRNGEAQVYLCIGWIRCPVYSSVRKKDEETVQKAEKKQRAGKAGEKDKSKKSLQRHALAVRWQR